MPIPSSYPLCQIENLTDRYRTMMKLPPDATWVVWWYCDVLPSASPGDTPDIKVAFRKALPDNTFSDFTWIPVPLAEIGNFKLGTAWRNAFQIGQVLFEARSVTFDFAPKNWRLTSFIQAKKNGDVIPFTPEEYPAYHGDNNGLLIIEDKRMEYIIPCAEFFSAWYGRSDGIRKDLTSLPLDDILKRILSDTRPATFDGKWRLFTKKRLCHDDMIFLAHAVHDADTKLNAGRIYKELFAQNKPRDLKFLQATPWFTGEAKMCVEGVPVNNGKGFLVLRIISRSNPMGPEIEAVAEEESRQPSSRTGGEAEKQDQINISMPPAVVEHVFDEPPSNGATTLQRFSSGVTIIGEKRKIRVYHPNKTLSVGKPSYIEASTDTFSTLTPSGSEGKIGEIRITTGYSSQTMGPHWDLWRALKLLQHLFPETVTEVNWYTPGKGYQTTIPDTFCQIGGRAQTTTDIKQLPKWLQIMAPAPELGMLPVLRVRGFLVAQVMIGSRSIHFLEIERSIVFSQANRKDTSAEFDHFSGLIFELDRPSSIKAVVQDVGFRMAKENGVLLNCLPENLGTFRTFVHNPSENEVVPGIQPILNAFKKLGIEFPEIDSKPQSDWNKVIFG